jgi:hypothetical protein
MWEKKRDKIVDFDNLGNVFAIPECLWNQSRRRMINLESAQFPSIAFPFQIFAVLLEDRKERTKKTRTGDASQNHFEKLPDKKSQLPETRGSKKNVSTLFVLMDKGLAAEIASAAVIKQNRKIFVLD